MPIGIRLDGCIPCFGRLHNLKLEVGLENSPRGNATTTIKSECVLCRNISHKGVEHFCIDKNNSSHEATLLFENICLPYSIWNMTKLEEVEYMKQLGLENIIIKTWFCHRPILGYTCGRCNPCKDALNEGMAYRVSKIGYTLGTLRLLYYRCKRIPKKIMDGIRRIKK